MDFPLRMRRRKGRWVSRKSVIITAKAEEELHRKEGNVDGM